MTSSDPPLAPNAPRRPRRWPIALLVGLINAIAAAIAVMPIADWVMAMHHVSTMEGGRACAVVGIWMPLAGLAGFISGFAVTLLIRRAGFIGYVLAQIAALAMAGIILGAAAAIGYTTADHPPLLQGKKLALEIEVQVPAKGRSVEALQAADFSVALVVSVSDRNYSDLRWVDAVKSNESIFVTAWAPLHSSNAGREITVGVEGENRQIFNVMLPAVPKKTESEWSEWTTPRQRFDGSKPAAEDQYLVRYRVRFADEYSPTPSPTATPSDAPAEEEPKDEASPEPSESP